MQNLRATTSLKPGGRNVIIAKYLSQMNIGHHCQKWKIPILGVEGIVLRDVFLASFFLAYMEQKLFFTIAWENSPVQLLTIATSSRGSICVGVLIYPVVMARWTAPFAVVSHTPLSC